MANNKGENPAQITLEAAGMIVFPTEAEIRAVWPVGWPLTPEIIQEVNSLIVAGIPLENVSDYLMGDQGSTWHVYR